MDILSVHVFLKVVTTDTVNWVRHIGLLLIAGHFYSLSLHSCKEPMKSVACK
jgi:hypothetical protein